MVVVPAVAGLDESTRRYEESRIAPWPVPLEFMVKIAGAKAARLTVWAAPAVPYNVAARVAVDCPANSHGTCRFTCRPETKYKGAAVPPPNSNERFCRLVTSGRSVSPDEEARKKSPKTSAMLPGATGAVYKIGRASCRE